MKKSNLLSAALTLFLVALLCITTVQAETVIVLEDFEPVDGVPVPELTEPGGDKVTVDYKNIFGLDPARVPAGVDPEPGWVYDNNASATADNFQIADSNGDGTGNHYMEQVAFLEGGTVRAGAAFQVDLSVAPIGWTFELDLIQGRFSNFSVFVGQDDLDNLPDDVVLNCNPSVSGNPPEDTLLSKTNPRNIRHDIVVPYNDGFDDRSWHSIDSRGWSIYVPEGDDPYHFVVDFSEVDLTGCDLVAFVAQIESNANYPDTVIFDNLVMVNPEDPPPPEYIGDINGDNRVDDEDLNLFLSIFPAPLSAEDQSNLESLLGNFGRTDIVPGNGAPVPEPATLTLVLLGFLSLVGFIRRKK